MYNGAVPTQCGRTSWRLLQVAANTSWSYAWFQTSDICALLGCFVAYSPIFKGQAQGLHPLRWTNRLFRNVTYTVTVLRCVKSQKRADLLSIPLGRANDHHNEVFPHCFSTPLPAYRLNAGQDRMFQKPYTQTKQGDIKNLLHFFKKFKSVFHSFLPDFRKSILKVPRLRPFVRPVRARFRWRRLSSIGGMIQAGENRSTRIKTYPNVILSTTHITWTDLGSNRGLRSERSSSNRLNHGTATCISLQEVK
jgi:hypothetical protein